jgi:hypothetical protein
MTKPKFEEFVTALERLCIDYSVTQLHVMRAITRIFNGSRFKGSMASSHRKGCGDCGVSVYLHEGWL